MRKIISVFVLAAMILSLFPVMTFAQEKSKAVLDSGICGAEGDNVLWTLYKDGELVISGEGQMQDFKSYGNVPPWTSYEQSILKITICEGVESVGANAFYSLDYTTAVDLPETITSIGEYSFFGSMRLCDIVIPSGVTDIGSMAFAACYSLDSIIIPGSVTTVDDNAFSSSNIKKVVIGDGITEISERMFNNCNKLECITIPASVMFVGKDAFANCLNITTVYYQGTQTQWEEMSVETGNGYMKTAYDIRFDCVCHKYEASMVVPSCTEKGYTKNECIYCCDTYNDTYVEAVPHTTTNGKCDMCEKIFVEVGETVSLSVTMDVQSEIEWVLAEDNAVITGTNRTSVVLGSFVRITETVNIKGVSVGVNSVTAKANGKEISTADMEILSHTHKYGISSVTAPTCTEKGFTTYSCPCGDSYNDNYTDLTEHSYVAIVKAPNCFETGYTEYLCGCGKSYVDDYIDKLEHECGWLTVAEPQIGIEGTEIYQCALCETIFEQRAIPALCALGDVNRDGKINAMDARLTLRVASKLEAFDDAFFAVADVTGDGKITALDARAILRHSAKIEFIK